MRYCTILQAWHLFNCSYFFPLVLADADAVGEWTCQWCSAVPSSILGKEWSITCAGFGGGWQVSLDCCECGVLHGISIRHRIDNDLFQDVVSRLLYAGFKDLVCLPDHYGTWLTRTAYTVGAWFAGIMDCEKCYQKFSCAIEAGAKEQFFPIRFSKFINIRFVQQASEVWSWVFFIFFISDTESSSESSGESYSSDGDLETD